MEGYAGPMKDALTTNEPPDVPREPGYVLHVSDRTTAAMQLAAHFTAQSPQLRRDLLPEYQRDRP